MKAIQHFLLKIAITSVLVIAPSLQGRAGGESPLWLRSAAISPDGQTICFAYKGDLFTISASGGQARQLTREAWIFT